MRYNALLHGSSRRWDIDRKPAKGGSPSAYYANANRLYGIQADTAEYMLDIGKDKLPGAVDTYEQAAMRYFDPAYEADMVGKANVDAQRAIGQNTAAMNRNMASYGLNPASGRYGAMMNQNAIGNASMQAGAANNARQYVQDKQFGASKDFYSSLIGINSDAASQAGNAASGFASMGNQASANQTAMYGNLGSAAMMGMDMYNKGEFKDGGLVKKRVAAKEPRMAYGGLFGGAGTLPPPPAGQGAPQPGPVDAAMTGMSGYKMGKTAANFAPKAMDQVGGMMKMSSAPGMQSAGMGLENASLNAFGTSGSGTAAATGAEAATAGTTAATGAEAAAAATGAETLGAAATGAELGAAAAGAEALGAGAAASTAASTAAAGGAAATGAMTAAAAIPWVGAALAVGSLFGLFAEGGKVEAPEKDVGKGQTFAQKAQIYQTMFGKPYIGSPEQDDAVREAISQQLVTAFNPQQQEAPGYAEGGKVDKRNWQQKLSDMVLGSREEAYARQQKKEQESGLQRVSTQPKKGTGYGGGETSTDRAIREQGLAKGGKACGPKRKSYVRGGEVDGPGTATSDSVPARLSDGEYVINAEAVSMPGVEQLLERINMAGLQRRYGGAS